MKLLEKIKERFELLHPLNYMVEESPKGEDWVRLRGYDCLGMFPDTIRDLNIEGVWALLEQCQDGSDVENMMLGLLK